MDECFICVVAHETPTPDRDRTFVKVAANHAPDLLLKQLQTGSPQRLVLQSCYRLPSQIFAQRVDRRFQATNKPWAAEGGWVKGVPLDLAEEVALYCAEEWVADGHRTLDVAALCDRAGIPCLVFASAVADFIKHPTLTDEAS